MTLLIVCLCWQMAIFSAQQKISSSEAKLLIPFFKLLLESSESGYVFFDKKPVCSVSYFQNPIFFDQFEPYEQLSVAVFTVRDVLKSPAFHTNNIIFHFDEKDEMLLIINRSLFLNTIKENLPLFQYVLGPTITPEFLLEAICSPNGSFCEILNFDRVLIGIALGYGVQNALFESRLENIQYDGTCTLDIPPYAPSVRFCSEESSKEAMFFLDHEENVDWKKGQKFQKPSLGFTSLQEEREVIAKRLVISTDQLTSVNPNFVFASLRENREFFQELEKTQKKIRHLLQRPDWFETTLEMICGDHVEIEQIENTNVSISIDMNYVLAKLLKQELQEKDHDIQYIGAFIEGLLQTHCEIDPVGDVISSPLAIKNIRLAKKSLEETDRFFSQLCREPGIVTVMEPYLYYKVLESGLGPCLKDEIEVLLDYEIIDPMEKRLSVESAVWLNLKEIIPGLAHGLQGMKREEKRVVYIHPSLAYGMHTYLQKGIYLKAIVKLREIGDAKEKLPFLQPLNLSFVKSEKFQQECEEEYKQALRFIGMKKGQFLSLCPGLNKQSIANYLKSMKNNDNLSQEESRCLNQFFWNLYFADYNRLEDGI